MFKFAFDIDMDETEEQAGLEAQVEVGGGDGVPKLPSEAISLEDLLKTLPDHISCSPIFPPGATPLLRRDLYDARFQVMTEADGDATDADGHEYVDASSDLIPGLYEGGLKTWEGGVDLVKVLADMAGSEDNVGAWVVGARVLEVGCGTGLPSAFVLRQVLQHLTSQAAGSSKPTTLHLQDYNSSVLSLVTLPNLILSSLPFLPSSSITYETADDEETVSYTEPGTLALSSELLSAFTDLLKTHSITLEFSCGDWSNFAQSISQPFNLVLTAETIYSENSIGALLDVLQRASEPIGSDWENALQQSGADRSLRALADGASVVLVAAKVIYFGVGGGINGFIHSLEERQGRHVTVLDIPKGVKRTVLRIRW